MGSVKDLVVGRAPTETEMGSGRFDFSNRYSVFDWGEMPDHIPYAGASRCMTSAYFFEQLEDIGVSTHYQGLVDDAGSVHSAAKASVPMTRMKIDLVRVVKPVPVTTAYGKTWYNYSFFRHARDESEGNYVVPLEVIYRNTLPKGSSVFRRLKEGTLSLKTMGLTEMPKEGDTLPRMFMDVSTKFERHDRYPRENGGENVTTFFQGMGGLTDDEMEEVEGILDDANCVITDELSRVGLYNDDGKIELAFTPGGELMIVDAVGTLDECRFTYPVNGQKVEMCKEIPRQHYRRTHPEWVDEIDKAKKSGKEDWKSLVRSRPRPMPTALSEIMNHVYGSFGNAVLPGEIFDSPSIPEVVRDYQRYMELEMK